jgi:quercetin dioxygenase-like cupin family protein
MRLLALLFCLGLAACSQEPAEDAPRFGEGIEVGMEIPEGLQPGSNEMLRSAVEAAPDLEVIVSDVIIPPGATVPAHSHPGEEFAYVIEGSAVHVEEGKPDLDVAAGQSFVIPPNAVHAPRGGPEGARAIVFRVHRKGQPERIPAGE